MRVERRLEDCPWCFGGMHPCGVCNHKGKLEIVTIHYDLGALFGAPEKERPRQQPKAGGACQASPTERKGGTSNPVE